MLRLKLQVQSVKKIVDRDGNLAQEEVELCAVYGPAGSPNEQWCKWTPSASLKFTVSNPAAFDKLRPGMFLFNDLTPCEKDSI